MTLLSLFAALDPALLVAAADAPTMQPLPAPADHVAAIALLGGSGITVFCTVLAMVLRRLGTRAKAITPAQMTELEQRKPRLAAGIAIAAALAWDFASIFEALPALIYGRPQSGAEPSTPPDA